MSTELWSNGIQVCKNDEGKLHREDGPAIIWSNGYTDWWYNGTPLSYTFRKWCRERNVEVTGENFVIFLFEDGLRKPYD